MSIIRKINAREILDSRGTPTIEVDLTTDDYKSRAAIPSGASTGIHEAVELRDNDPKRYFGKGVQTAVKNVNTIINDALIGLSVLNQKELDLKMIELDGTQNKAKLGANAILGVSLAISKMAAMEKKIPLYQHFSEISGNKTPIRIPMPMMNIINGGKHADSGLSIQEFMIIPSAAQSFKEALRYGAEVFHSLKTILKKKGYSTAVGDEGGFAPHLHNHEEAFEIILEAIDASGHLGDINIAIDAAASEFMVGDKYKIGEQLLTSSELTEYYVKLVEKFPIISIEDSHGEDDFEGFKECFKQLGDKIQLVGDDLFVTNTKRIKIGIDQQLANSVLIKLNQIGTVTETIEAITMANNKNWTSVVSHRSGETEDTTIADFTVGLGTGQIKTGSLSRTERICKYNQLLRIEEKLGSNAVFNTH